ncbi:MAG: hypothetical protein HY683_05790 [Chloroflexi bacterium]|nr:hypothetical protein [Chloroflexota bacterium]
MELLSLIDKLESQVTTSARLPATKKVLLDLDRVLDMVDQIRLAVPKDVQEAAEVLTKREGIINQAILDSRRIKSMADEESKAKVDQSEVLRQANQRGEEMQQNAQRKADAIVAEGQRRAQQLAADAEAFADARVKEANVYAQQVLSQLEQSLSGALNSIHRGLDALDRQEETSAVG